MNGTLGGTAFIKMPDDLSFLPRKKTPALLMLAGVVMLAGGLGGVFCVASWQDPFSPSRGSGVLPSTLTYFVQLKGGSPASLPLGMGVRVF